MVRFNRKGKGRETEKGGFWKIKNGKYRVRNLSGAAARTGDLKYK